jgi:hypothetical protein
MQAWGSGAAMPPHPPPYMFQQTFHGAPSKKCKKKGPQTLATKLVAFTIRAI